MANAVEKLIFSPSLPELEQSRSADTKSGGGSGKETTAGKSPVSRLRTVG